MLCFSRIVHVHVHVTSRLVLGVQVLCSYLSYSHPMSCYKSDTTWMYIVCVFCSNSSLCAHSVPVAAYAYDDLYQKLDLHVHMYVCCILNH